MEDIKTLGPEFLLDSGLLFKINLEVLHPLGLALALDLDTGKVDIWDYRSDPEGLLYAADAYKVGLEKLNKFATGFVNERLVLREKTLGYIVQPDPNIPTAEEE